MPVKTMRDSSGADIPVKYIPAYDRARDALVRKIHKRFKKARAMLEAVLADTLSDINKFKQQNDVAENKGGNFQISSFDGDLIVAIEQKVSILLDERVITAREMMLAYAQSISGRVGGNDGDALMQIISAAFTSNKRGMLAYPKVIELLHLNINSQQWRDAQALLQAAISTERGKAYLSCSERPNRQQPHKQIILNLADCWSADPETLK